MAEARCTERAMALKIVEAHVPADLADEAMEALRDLSAERWVQPGGRFGAIVGAGIGLLLTQAIITQKNWEEVTYYLVLIVLMVMIMDFISGKIRGG